VVGTVTSIQIGATGITTLAAVLGVGVGIGLLLVIIGIRGLDPHRRRPVQDRVRRLTTARTDRSWRRAGLAVASGVLIGVVTGWVVGAVLAGIAAWALPRVLGRDPEHARRVTRIEAIATWTEMLRDTLSAAAGLEQAILATAPLAPPAIRGELADTAARIENGDRLASALRRLADKLADPTGDLVIAALVLAAQQQARQLGDLLGSLAHAAREQASMRMRIEAGRARNRTSVRVIVGTTLAFAVAVVLLNSDYVSAYDSTTGQLVLLGIGGLFALGFTWLMRIATVTDPDRFLALTEDAPTGQNVPVTERQV
jgi:tight adherence protein B